MWNVVQSVVATLAEKYRLTLQIVDILDGLVTVRVSLPLPAGSPGIAELRSTLAAQISIRAPEPVTVLIEGHEPADASQDTRIAAAVQHVLATEINPFVADHGGKITLLSVKNALVTVRMDGGCQGCSQAAATLSRGVVEAIHRAVPGVIAVHDATDHQSGETPFYQ